MIRKTTFNTYKTSNIAQWLLNLQRQESHQPDEIQLKSTKLLLVVKFLRELHHRATPLFLNLRRQCRSLRSKKDQMHTPESVGSTMVGGRLRGDSGYALKEELLGGSLRHHHLVKNSSFVLSFLSLAAWSCPQLSYIYNMLIACVHILIS